MRRVDWVLVAIVVLAAALRFYHIGAQSFWLDELISITNSTGYQQLIEKVLPEGKIIAHPPEVTGVASERPWFRVWGTLNREVHPPLYYLILRWWRALAGDGDVAARLLSTLASLIAVLLIYDVGRLLFGVAAGRWAALLMALAPPQIVFAQEARSYTILLALALGAAAALLRLHEYGPNRARTIALGACSLALTLTHYFSLGVLAALALYAATSLSPPAKRAALRAWLVAAGIFIVVWGPFFLHQKPNIHSGFLNDAGPDHLPRVAWRFLTAPGRFLVNSMFGTSPRFEKLLWLAAPIAYLVPIALIQRRRALLLPMLWLSLSLALLAALDGAHETQMLGLFRYTLIASPGFYLLTCGMLSHRGAKLRHLLPAAALLVTLVALPIAYQPFKQDWRRVGQYIDKNVRPGEVVVIPVAVIDGDWWGYAWQLYTAISHYAYSPNRPILILNRPASPELLAQLHAAPGVWIASYRGVAPTEVLPGCTPQAPAELWPVVALYRVTVNLPEPAKR